jgi:hypothetical protein
MLFPILFFLVFVIALLVIAVRRSAKARSIASHNVRRR